MNRTLLAHLVPKMTSQVEDAATEALGFILNKSQVCRQALTELLRGVDFPLEVITKVATQVFMEDKCRPDMAGYDQTGAMRLLVEAKFWASLGESQADGYFRHLDKETSGPGVLLFIAPDSRVGSLWAEVESQMEEGQNCYKQTLGPIEHLPSVGPIRKARVGNSEKHLMLVSWSRILEALGEAAQADQDPVTGFEIAQLQGLADHVERRYATMFDPLTDDDLQPHIPRRILSMIRLVDDTVDKAQASGWVSKAKKSAPKGGGYGKYIKLCGPWVWFGVYPRVWASRWNLADLGVAV